MGINLFGSNHYAIDLSRIQFNGNTNRANTKTNPADSFYSTSVIKTYNEAEIQEMISKNPKIKNILTENNIELKLNMKELEDLYNNHAKDTANIALAIARNLPSSLKQNVDFYTLKQGAILHDIGKVLIPDKILNKPSNLTPQEHKIMDLHSELGYELLKNSDVNEDVLKLVRYHHKPYDTTPDINLQILNLADKYSALTEKRVYKEAFSPKSALTLLYPEVKNGNINPMLFNALVNAVNVKTSQNKSLAGM